MHCTFEELMQPVLLSSRLDLPFFFGRVGLNSLSPNPLTKTSKKLLNIGEVQAGRQDSVTGGHKQFLLGHKKFNAPNLIVWTKKQRFSLRIFTNSGVKTKKMVFISKNVRIFTIFGVEPQKKGSLLQNLQKKQFLLKNSGVTTSILRVSGFDLHYSGIERVTSFRVNPRFRGHNSCLGGHSLLMPSPSWHRAW